MIIVFPLTLTFFLVFGGLWLLREFLKNPIGFIVQGAIGLFLIFFICNWLAHPEFKVDQVVVASFSDIKNANWPWK